MKTRVQKSVFISFVIFLLSLVFVFSHFFKAFELATQDWRQSVCLKHQQLISKRYLAKDNIVIISMDDMTSFDLSQHPELNIRRWPLSRSVWSELINFVEKGSPKVVAIDVPFQNYEDITLSANSSDLVLSNTLKKYNNIVLSTVLSSSYNESKNESSSDFLDKFNNPFKPIKKSLKVTIADKALDDFLTYFSYSPIPDIFVNNSLIGYRNIRKDTDSVVRYTRPVSRVITENDVYYVPSFPFAVFLKYIGYKGPINITDKGFSIKKYSVPLNKSGENMISWNGLSRSYTFIPLSKVIIGMRSNGKSFVFDKKTYPVQYFKDKIVIIAPTQTNVDTYVTPVDKNLTGAEISANIIDNYINDSKLDNPIRRKFIEPANKYLSVLIVLILCSLIILNILFFQNAPLSLFNSFLIIFMYFIFSIFAFINPRISLDFPLIYPIYFMFVSLISSYFYVLFDEICRKKEITNTFGKFVSSVVLTKLLKNSQNFELKTAKKKISVLYCSVSNFTAISERYSADEVVERLNRVFEIIADRIFKYNGTIDKFIGDAVMAYWGDPIVNVNDASSAVKAAVEILEDIDDFNVTLGENDLKFDVKIAVNTGEVLVGSVGTGKILDYTILGDTVNSTSRMVQICNQFDKRFMISQTTYDEVKSFIQADFAGSIKLKGKNAQVGVYVPKLGRDDD